MIMLKPGEFATILLWSPNLGNQKAYFADIHMAFRTGHNQRWVRSSTFTPAFQSILQIIL
jgi:hypothetical protein